MYGISNTPYRMTEAELKEAIRGKYTDPVETKAIDGKHEQGTPNEGFAIINGTWQFVGMPDHPTEPTWMKNASPRSGRTCKL